MPILDKTTASILRGMRTLSADKRGGFTLVEILVALAIFTIAISMASSGFITILRSDREIGAFISVEGNTNLAIEQMAREIRTGTRFTYISGDHSQLIFVNANGVHVLYCQKTFAGIGAILRVSGPLADLGCSSAVAQNKITSDSANVQSLRFKILSCPNVVDLSICPIGTPPLPPRVTISASVTAIAANGIPPVDLETTVSARNF